MLAAMPAPAPASARISSTLVTSGTSPAASSARPVKARVRASIRRRDSDGSRAGAVRMPTTTPPVSAPTIRPNRTGPPPRSLACSTDTATAAATAPATDAPASTSSGRAPVRPLSGPAACRGRRRPSSGERGRGVRAPGSSRKVTTDSDAANSPAATYEARAAWCSPNHSMPVPSRLLHRAAATSVRAASGIATKPVRSDRRRRASRWSGSGRMLAPSGGGPGSSAGAAPSRDTVQKRSATPATNAVTRRSARALPGVQSIHSGATISRAARSPSAPTMVQRRSSGPSCEVSDVSGPRSTAPNSSVARIRTPKTVATANAAPRYPPPNACSTTEAWRARSTSTRRARTSPTPPTSCALHNRFTCGRRSRARTARSRESATRASSGAGGEAVGCSARVMRSAYRPAATPRGRRA